MQKAFLKVKDFLAQTPLIAAFSGKAKPWCASRVFSRQNQAAINSEPAQNISQRLRNIRAQVTTAANQKSVAYHALFAAT